MPARVSRGTQSTATVASKNCFLYTKDSLSRWAFRVQMIAVPTVDAPFYLETCSQSREFVADTASAGRPRTFSLRAAM